MIIDTHCHLIDEAFNEDVEDVINHSAEEGVGKVVLACCDNSEYQHVSELCQKHPEMLYPTIGIHPENLANDIDEQIAEFENILRRDHDDLVAVGEIGLDLHWDKTRFEEQKEIFTKQVFLALEYDLPLLLHIRDAVPEFLEILHNIYNNITPLGLRMRGILHCYSGTIEEAEEAMKMGDFFLGIGGTVTYKKSDRIEIVRHFGLDHIVLETDAPYLAPVPHRGKRNEPAYTADVAKYIAETLSIPIEEVAETTTRNAEKLFHFQ